VTTHAAKSAPVRFSTGDLPEKERLPEVADQSGGAPHLFILSDLPFQADTILRAVPAAVILADK
jgi:hypothetical protein